MGVPVADSCRCLTEQQKFCNSPSIKKQIKWKNNNKKNTVDKGTS